MKLPALFIAIALWASLSQATIAQNFTNGSFEGATTDYSGFNMQIPPGWWGIGTTPDTYNAARTTGSMSMAWCDSPDRGDFIHLTAGQYDTPGNTYYEQVVQKVSGLTVGQLYKLTFYSSISYVDQGWLRSTPGSARIDVYLADGTIPFRTGYADDLTDVLLIGSSASMDSPDMGTVVPWIMTEIEFTARYATEAFVFRSAQDQIGGSQCLGLDGASLQVIPEPSAALLLGVIGSSLILLRHKRPNK